MNSYDIIEAVSKAGSHFFGENEMRIFRSRVYDPVFEGPGGTFFITSERFHSIHSGYDSRAYTVRQFSPDDPTRLKTMGEFQQYDTLGKARTAAKNYAKQTGEAAVVAEMGIDRPGPAAEATEALAKAGA